MTTKRSERIKESALLGGVGGGLSSLIAGKPSLKSWLIRSGMGAALGGGAQAVGDAVTGDPEGTMGQLGSGLVGGALIGAPAGLLEMGMKKEGGALARWLSQKHGISPKAAALSLLGGGAIMGALGRGTGQAIDSAALEYGRNR